MKISKFMPKYININNLIFLLVLANCFLVATANATGPIVWTASSLIRIGQTDSPGTSTTVTQYQAKNETYSFQVAIQAPTGGLTNVNIKSSGLTGPNGAVIDSNNIVLFREQYIYIPITPTYYWAGTSDGTNVPNGPGWYPDGLVPFVDPETGQPAKGGSAIQAVPFNLTPGMNQPIWVDITTPANTAAGTYTGTLNISSDQGKAVVSVTLNVWNFALPVTPTFKSSYQSDHNQNVYMQRELLRNRVSPMWDTPQAEPELMQDWGINSTNMWFDTGINTSNCATAIMPPAPSVAAFQAAAAQHSQDLLLYAQPVDEVSNCPNIFPELKLWAANMHQSSIQDLVTAVPVPALEDDGTGTGRSVVDIWVELPFQYDQALSEIKKVQAKGDAVWSYNVLIQDGYSPKLEIQFAPLDYRLNMGFISQTLNLKGFFQWDVDNWPSQNTAWTDVTGTMPVPSEGILVYPGQQVGIVGYAPSMRLKYTRDGVNDFEYVEMLKNMGQGAWALQEAATVGPNWKSWTRDPAQIEAVRVLLGNKISQSSSTPASYTLTVDVSGNGTINENPNSAGYQPGSNVVLTALPAMGYQFSNWSGAASGSTNPLTLTMNANTSVTANFSVQIETITASAASGGTISPSGTVNVNYGTNQKFMVTANSGYTITSVLVDGTPVTLASDNSYNFTNVTAAHTIAAGFTVNTYTITASASTGGLISPAGTTSVNYSASQKFMVTPNTGYSISNVLVDGSPVTLDADNSYTLTDVTSVHSIGATFTPITITITASAGSNGSISPSGTSTVNYDGSQVYSITANTGYQIASVIINGTALTNAPSSYTFLGVTANQTISAIFIPITYAMNVTTTNGSVTQSVNGVASNGPYNAGSVVTLIATAASGYQFSSWSGAITGTINPATIPMSANQNVTANFILIPPVTYSLKLKVNNTNYGSIIQTVNGAESSGPYQAGTVVILKAIPASGYQFSSWSGAVTGTTNPISLTMNAKKHVKAKFIQIHK